MCKFGGAVYNDTMITITVGANDEHRRLDRFLRQYFDAAPLSLIYRLIRKDVKVNGKRSSREAMLREGDTITVYMDAAAAGALRSDRTKGLSGGQRSGRPRRQFSVLYEDASVLVVGKPAGLLTHGDAHEKKNTLVNQVEGYLLAKGDYVPSRENTFRPAPVHRLDRNTSGLVVFGKTAEALRTYGALLSDKNAVEKEYRTIALGEFRDTLRLQGTLLRDEEANRSHLVASRASRAGRPATESDEKQGKAIETVALPLATAQGYTLVKVLLLTGRTHQIRLHLAESGHPIAGDPKYGDAAANQALRAKYGLRGQLLHCAAMTFHEGPLAGRRIACPEPKAFREIQRDIFGETAENE